MTETREKYKKLRQWEQERREKKVEWDLDKIKEDGHTLEGIEGKYEELRKFMKIFEEEHVIRHKQLTNIASGFNLLKRKKLLSQKEIDEMNTFYEIYEERKKEYQRILNDILYLSSFLMEYEKTY